MINESSDKVNNWLNGRTHIPLDAVRRIARALDLNFFELVGDIDSNVVNEEMPAYLRKGPAVQDSVIHRLDDLEKKIDLLLQQNQNQSEIIRLLREREEMTGSVPKKALDRLLKKGQRSE